MQPILSSTAQSLILPTLRQQGPQEKRQEIHLATEYQWREVDARNLYPKSLVDNDNLKDVFDLRMIHEDCRRVDARNYRFASTKVNYGNENDTNGDQTHRLGDKRFLAGFETSSGKVCELPKDAGVQMTLNTGTQCPSLVLTFPNSDKSKVTLVIQPDMIATDCTTFGLVLHSPQTLLECDWIPVDCDILKTLSENQTLFAIDLTFKTGLRKTWMGFDPDTALHSSTDLMTEALSWLDQCDGVRLFLRLPKTKPEDAKQLESFFLYVRTCWWLCNTRGYFWFYQSQFPEKDLSDITWDFTRTVPPRWMATKWSITPEEAGDPVVEAIEWASFPVVHYWPRDPKYAGFAHKLGIARERIYACNKFTEITSLTDSTVKFYAKFYPDPTARAGDMKVTYFVALSVVGAEGDQVWPENEISARLEVPATEDRERWVFAGTTCEDIFETECPICLAVTGRYYDEIFDGSALTEKDILRGGYQATLQFLDDPTSAARETATIDRLLESHSPRKTGVDLLNFCFGSPTPGQVTAVDVAQEKTIAIIDRLSECSPPPTAQQLGIVHSFLHSPTATMLLQGPPGTGKTYTTALAIIACLVLGYKVLVTSPSNEPLRVAYDVFQQYLSIAEIDESQVLLFKGAYSTLKRLAVFQATDNMTRGESRHPHTTKTTHCTSETAGDDDEGPGGEPRNKIHTFIADLAGPEIRLRKTFQDGYSAKLQAKIDDAVDSGDDSKFAELAAEYISVRDEVRSRKWINKKGRIDKLNSLTAIEQALHEDYLGEQVRVVFTTCATSCHPLLRQHFKPDVIFTEEAAMGTPADVFTPLAAFKDVVQMVFHSGDHRQTTPFVNCSKSNEMYTEMRTSHFALLMHDPRNRWPKAMLQIQFRMHPHISEWPASNFYELDKKVVLVDAPDVAKQDAPLQITLQEIFQKLGPAWNGRFRVGIDVSGKTKSARWGTMASLFNQHEAELIAILVRYMVNYEPTAPEARKIVPGDIYMVSPYKAQQRYLSLLFTKSGDALDLELAKRVKTTVAMQGKEASIVFVSQTVNIPNEPATLKFSATKRILNVNATRAKNMLIWVGNWAGWCKAERSDDVNMCRNKYNTIMLSMVKDFFVKYKDVVASEDIEEVFANGGATPQSSAFAASMQAVCDQRKVNIKEQVQARRKKEAEEEAERRKAERKQAKAEKQKMKRAAKEKLSAEERVKQTQDRIRQQEEEMVRARMAENRATARGQTGGKNQANDSNRYKPRWGLPTSYGNSAASWRREEFDQAE